MRSFVSPSGFPLFLFGMNLFGGMDASWAAVEEDHRAKRVSPRPLGLNRRIIRVNEGDERWDMSSNERFRK
jgi:hypothetical protein